MKSRTAIQIFWKYDEATKINEKKEFKITSSKQKNLQQLS